MLEHLTDQKTNEIRHILASFTNVGQLEDAVELLQQCGFRRSQISVIASQDVVKRKLSQLYRSAAEFHENGQLPQTLFVDRHDIVDGRSLAIGTAVFIGGMVDGFPVVATGGTLAFASIIEAAGLAGRSGIGTIFSHVLDWHSAEFLEKQLASGVVLLGLDTSDEHEEQYATYLLKKVGGHHVTTHMITRYWRFDGHGLDGFDPYLYGGGRSVMDLRAMSARL